MNARKIFKDCPALSPEEVGDLIQKEFYKLRTAIFSVMPEECFLKMWNFLNLTMIFMLSPKMVGKKGVVSRKDICSLCSAESCPFNNVDFKNFRVIKVKLLGNLYNR